MSIADIFANLALLISFEKKIEELVAAISKEIANEKDKALRKAIVAAYERRDLDEMRRLMFETLEG